MIVITVISDRENRKSVTKNDESADGRGSRLKAGERATRAMNDLFTEGARRPLYTAACTARGFLARAVCSRARGTLPRLQRRACSAALAVSYPPPHTQCNAMLDVSCCLLVRVSSCDPWGQLGVPSGRRAGSWFRSFWQWDLRGEGERHVMM